MKTLYFSAHDEMVDSISCSQLGQRSSLSIVYQLTGRPDFLHDIAYSCYVIGREGCRFTACVSYLVRVV